MDTSNNPTQELYNEAMNLLDKASGLLKQAAEKHLEAIRQIEPPSKKDLSTALIEVLGDCPACAELRKNLTPPNLARFTFTEYELRQMTRIPDVLRALADWHDVQESMADGRDMFSSSQHHRSRRSELNKEAERIELEWP